MCWWVNRYRNKKIDFGNHFSTNSDSGSGINFLKAFDVIKVNSSQLFSLKSQIYLKLFQNLQINLFI